MKCRDCINFRQSNRMEDPRARMETGRERMEAGRQRMETAKEISPEVRETRGTCSVNNTRCRAEDKCRSGAFSQK